MSHIIIFYETFCINYSNNYSVKNQKIKTSNPLTLKLFQEKFMQKKKLCNYIFLCFIIDRGLPISSNIVVKRTEPKLEFEE